MLLSLILIPLISSIIIIIGKNKGRLISLIVSIINMILTLTIYIKWNNNNVGYQIIENWWNIVHIGIDSISLIMIILTSIVMCLSTLASWRSIQSKLFYFYITIMSSILMGVFLTLDLIPFFICFEGSLIPMFLLIGTYGSNKERKIYAAFSIMLTTLIGSLIMLLTILSIYSYIGSNVYIIANDITYERQNILWLGLLAALGIKTPIIPFHLWLPEAHTEANISGSIILAGVLLKLATYGYLRLSIGLMPYASYYYTPLIYAISITSLIYSSLSTLRQIDLKKIIAYSSIGHMSLVNIGLFSNNLTGIFGGLLLSFAHGIVSPALFLLVTFLYDRYHTRIIFYFRGLNFFMPIFSTFFFLFTLANMATPLTGNFNGELLILSGSWLHNPISVILAALAIILSAAYSIWLFNRVSFGTVKLFRSYDITRFEFSLLFPCILIILILGINPNLLFLPYII